MTTLLSIAQVAEALGQSESWVCRKVYQKKLAYYKLGRVKMFAPEHVKEFLEAQLRWSTEEKAPMAGGSTTMTQRQASRGKGSAKQKESERLDWKPFDSRPN